MTRRVASLSRRGFVKIAAGAAAALPFTVPGGFRVFAAGGAGYTVHATDLVESSLVIDMLSLLDMPKALLAESRGEDPGRFTREELLAIMESGIDVFHPAVGISGPDAFASCLEFMATYNGLVAEHPDLVVRIDSASDLAALQRSGRLGIILGTQNSDHFRTVEDVKTFYYLGQRVSQLTYNSQNRIGSGSTDRVDGGLSDFGVSIVRAMNEIGMAVDVSHCGDRTTLDACEISSKPVLITHSNCRALVAGHPRCKTDEAIENVAATGGVMGITAVRNFVTNEEPTTIEDYVEHIDHVVQLVGIDHVGIGTDSDLNGYDDLPPDYLEELKSSYNDSYGFREKIDIEGLDYPGKIFEVTGALIRRGYSDDNIRLILGGNFQRVLNEIWSPSPAAAKDSPEPPGRD